MDDRIKLALRKDRTIDITTFGRKSGRPRRIEIWFHNLHDRIFITGLPGRRDWYANLKATPDFTFHLKESIQADLPARARAVVDEAERRVLFTGLLKKLAREADFDKWLADSPLVEITFTDE